MTLKMQGCKNDSFCKELLDRFELKADKKTREMSLGEKRKLAIVAAFMHDPEILILDEPTSGLDPVMQQEFIEFVREEKTRGKTIFLSSHIFSEVDALCDRIAIIKEGHIVSEFKSTEIKQAQEPIYAIRFSDVESYNAFRVRNYTLTADSAERIKIKVRVPSERMNEFISDMESLQIDSFHKVPFSLEDYFMNFYKSEEVQA